MTVHRGMWGDQPAVSLADRQLEWARQEASRYREQRNEARRENFALREIARLARAVCEGLDEDGFRTEPPGGYDAFAQAVDDLRVALGRVEA